MKGRNGRRRRGEEEEEKEREKRREGIMGPRLNISGATQLEGWGGGGGGTNRPALSNGLLSLLEYLLNSIGPIDSITLQCGWMVENNRRRLVRVY